MIKEVKKKMLRLFFTLEIMIFLCVYCFGAHSLIHVYRLHQEIATVDAEIATLACETQTISARLVAWHNHPYYKEKVAREQLQMAQPGEEIYYVI